MTGIFPDISMLESKTPIIINRKKEVKKQQEQNKTDIERPQQE